MGDLATFVTYAKIILAQPRPAKGRTAHPQPDIVYPDPARLGAISQRGVEGGPTLVVEVLSPATTLIDRSTKHQLYSMRAMGCPSSGWWIPKDAR